MTTERRKIIRIIRQKEEAGRIRRACGKGFMGRLCRTEVPDGQFVDQEGRAKTAYRACTTQTTVEEGCRDENMLRFSQTFMPHCSPPMQPGVFRLLTGEEGRVNSEAVLMGTFDTKLVESECM